MSHAFTFEELDRMLGKHAPFLVSLLDGLEQELHIVIAAAELGEPDSDHPEPEGFFEGLQEKTQQALRDILAGARPIEMNERCQFEITFRDYILYQVRNESFSSWSPAEVGRGKYLITFERSVLLAHLHELTDAQQMRDGSFYPGRWTHYGICTQDHLIDVISHCPPEISRCEG